MAIEYTGDLCKDGVVPVLLTIALGLVVLASGRRIMKAERAEVAHSKRIAPAGDFWGWMEDFFIGPFVPTSLEVFAAFLFLWAFSQTVTMAFTRVFDGQWKNQFITQQWVQNFVTSFFGCAPFPPNSDGMDGNLTVITYAMDGDTPTDRRGKLKGNPLEFREGIDFAIGLHLTFGLLWLTIGGLQVALARYGWSHDKMIRHTAHRFFGMFGVVVFFCHMAGAAHILWFDVAHHTVFVKCILLSDIVMSLFYVFGALYYQHVKRNNVMHTTLMFYGYLQSIEGSGTIRTAGWALWMMSHFVS